MPNKMRQLILNQFFYHLSFQAFAESLAKTVDLSKKIIKKMPTFYSVSSELDKKKCKD